MDLDRAYWENRYTENRTGWDIGYASTPLVSYFDQLPDKHISILIPGCGNAYEAAHLHQNGFDNVYILDWSRQALEAFLERTPGFPKHHLICDDFFAHDGCYDLVVEQTFFCSLRPDERPEYVRHVHRLLKTGGVLAGVLFKTHFERKGPPFGGTLEEYRDHFEPYFDILHLEDCYNSIEPRLGNELFIEMKKKDA